MGTDLACKPAEILLVEDNPGDVRLAIEGLREAGARGRVSVVKDGVEAMEFLRREGPFAEAPRPDVILLDLNLPKKDGREVLADIKADEDLRQIPVLILTSSDAESDILGCYELNANCYLRKPADLDQFIGMMRLVERFWLHAVQLPSRC
jgi:CheY-like chemotaxis protein